MFVCFAPKDNPKIAIAVAVQNAGYGATWGGPIARILMEKFLLDSLTNKSKADLDRISKTNLLPSYFNRLQYKTDSVRAEEWAKAYGDSTRLKRFLRGFRTTPDSAAKKPADNTDDKKPADNTQKVARFDEKKYFRKPFENAEDEA